MREKIKYKENKMDIIFKMRKEHKITRIKIKWICKP